RTDFRARYETLKAKHLSLASIYKIPVDFDLQKEEDLWFEAVEAIRGLTLVDGEYFTNRAIAQGKRILAEGAQGSMLDIDFGTYPFVTSSNTVAAGVCTGLGVSPDKIGEIIGISKAYCTRVGAGPFPTELSDETGEMLRRAGSEFGATTGRPRRCGWIDLPQLRYAIMVNGVTQIAMTKLDVLNTFPEIYTATAYRIGDVVSEDIPYDLCASPIEPIWKSHPGWQQPLPAEGAFQALPLEARSYLQFLENALQTPISMISTGPERSQLIIRPTDY
ncbi:MAG: adenylosuccinate synthetase, partial [Saprospiraceae bacterium]